MIDSVEKELQEEVVDNFFIYGEVLETCPYGSGHINDTFRVTMNQGGTIVRYIFQHINDYVFTDPPTLMDNIRRVTEHQQRKLNGVSDASRRALQLIPARSEKFYYRSKNGRYWRAYIFIENAATYDITESPQQAFEGAKAFGSFQAMLADMPGERLSETIPDFHNTPKRYADFERVLDEDPLNRAQFATAEIHYARKQTTLTNVLLDLKEQGKIPERITHNDTKLNNVMIDNKSGAGICVIDLDTVMPGLSLYDFGDMVRSGANPAAEDEYDLEKVYVHMETFEALVEGFLTGTGNMLTPAEKNYLAFSARLITYETGLRFLTDYLQGDLYFKTQTEDHNLYRSRTQFRLVESMEKQYDQMQQIVEKNCSCHLAGRML